jgi:hypothetical protein
MRVLQEMLKNPTKTMDPYVGIARDAKNTSQKYTIVIL